MVDNPRPRDVATEPSNTFSLERLSDWSEP